MVAVSWTVPGITGGGRRTRQSTGAETGGGIERSPARVAPVSAPGKDERQDQEVRF